MEVVAFACPPQLRPTAVVVDHRDAFIGPNWLCIIPFGSGGEAVMAGRSSGHVGDWWRFVEPLTGGAALRRVAEP